MPPREARGHDDVRGGMSRCRTAQRRFIARARRLDGRRGASVAALLRAPSVTRPEGERRSGDEIASDSAAGGAWAASGVALTRSVASAGEARRSSRDERRRVRPSSGLRTSRTSGASARPRLERLRSPGRGARSKPRCCCRSALRAGKGRSYRGRWSRLASRSRPAQPPACACSRSLAVPGREPVNCASLRLPRGASPALPRAPRKRAPRSRGRRSERPPDPSPPGPASRCVPNRRPSDLWKPFDPSCPPPCPSRGGRAERNELGARSPGVRRGAFCRSQRRGRSASSRAGVCRPFQRRRLSAPGTPLCQAFDRVRGSRSAQPPRSAGPRRAMPPIRSRS